ncbi:MAG: hypothetical protein M1821_007319 [Bathelium mastoideum]|nr:MAG: hypothetical protein M1821_007319 [Bathelium mastoideum]KAI9694823.1 MAG: hypothetical protein M1822_000439 [Bathelium mastoideum]
MAASKSPQLRSSLESTHSLLSTQPADSQPSTAPPPFEPSPPPPAFDEYYAPRARDFADNASLAPSTTSTLPAYTPGPRYGRFKSERAYLAALHEFAEEKKYMEPSKDLKGREVGLVGFYGEKPMSEYAPLPPPWRKERKGSKAEGAGGAGSSRQQQQQQPQPQPQPQQQLQQGRKGSLTGLGLREKMRARKKSVVAE